jgi:hypothetical protein
MVDAGRAGQLARGRQLGPRPEPAVLDRRDEGLRELCRDRRMGVSVDRRYQVGQ